MHTVHENPAITAKWIDGANEGQAEAIATLNGPVLILAGAGAGKTKVMISRTANLISHGVQAEKIIIVTFTNQAAEEIKERLGKLLGEEGEKVIAGTFHSICLNQILKPYVENNAEFMDKLRLKPGFSIIDGDESNSAMRHVIKEMGEELQERFENFELDVREIQKRMGLWRSAQYSSPIKARDRLTQMLNYHLNRIDSNQELSAQEAEDKKLHYKYKIDKSVLITEIWELYQAYVRESLNAIDFDDILGISGDLLDDHPELTKELSEKFSHIMIDEFQDTNMAQMKIVKKLTEYNKNIGVVGDPKQSIYKFRGADIRNILEFRNHYKNTKETNIIVNYRSQSMILRTANECTRFMPDIGSMIDMEACESMRTSSDRAIPIWYPCNDADEEAQKVVRLIQQYREKRPEETLALLYRSRKVKEAIEQKLIQKQVPFEVIGDMSFYDRKEVKDAIALARFLLYPHNRPAALRFIASTSLNMSEKTIAKQVEESCGVLSPYSILDNYSREVKTNKKPTQKALISNAVISAIEFMRPALNGEIHPDHLYNDLMAFWNVFLRNNLESYIKNRTGAGDTGSSLENAVANVSMVFDRIRAEMKEGRTLDSIFDDLSLMAMNSKSILNANESNPVKLMTIHASKGMEFDHVIIPGNDMGNADLIKFGLTHVDKHEKMSREELEDERKAALEEANEERRVMYVGITRAKKSLKLLSSKVRLSYGREGVKKEKRVPSIFIQEIRNSLNIMGTAPKPEVFTAGSAILTTQSKADHNNSKNSYDIEQSPMR